jgi:hypothetical protein
MDEGYPEDELGAKLSGPEPAEGGDRFLHDRFRV